MARRINRKKSKTTRESRKPFKGEENANGIIWDSRRPIGGSGVNEQLEAPERPNKRLRERKESSKKKRKAKPEKE